MNKFGGSARFENYNYGDDDSGENGGFFENDDDDQQQDDGMAMFDRRNGGGGGFGDDDDDVDYDDDNGGSNGFFDDDDRQQHEHFGRTKAFRDYDDDGRSSDSGSRRRSRRASSSSKHAGSSRPGSSRPGSRRADSRHSGSRHVTPSRRAITPVQGMQAIGDFDDGGSGNRCGVGDRGRGRGKTTAVALQPPAAPMQDTMLILKDNVRQLNDQHCQLENMDRDVTQHTAELENDIQLDLRAVGQLTRACAEADSRLKMLNTDGLEKIYAEIDRYEERLKDTFKEVEDWLDYMDNIAGAARSVIKERESALASMQSARYQYKRRLNELMEQVTRLTHNRKGTKEARKVLLKKVTRMLENVSASRED